ncbi:hypothetical protein HY971_02785 [Candidatus Kaiserbacteria bacterium]|nr:hypothetical protein [Candidatus Kaiserbacteria bacterium]
MEKERAEKSVSFYVTNGGFSPIFVTAAISALTLLVAAGWQINTSVRERGAANSYIAPANGSGASAPDTVVNSALASDTQTTIGIAVVDGIVAKYLSLQEQGLYTPEVAAKTAEKMAETLKVPVPFRTYTAADVVVDADTSYARMLAYRRDLQISLAPLLSNTQPEYEIFAYYVSTKDKKNLEKLQRAAQNYREAASSTAHVVVPKDALTHHLAILNSTEEFAATLDALVANADDPFASAVLLRTYNQGEADVLTSFAGLARYYREKKS